MHDHPNSSDWNSCPAVVLHCSYLYGSACVPRQCWVAGSAVAISLDSLHLLAFPACSHSLSVGGSLALPSEEVQEGTRYVLHAPTN